MTFPAGVFPLGRRPLFVSVDKKMIRAFMALAGFALVTAVPAEAAVKKPAPKSAAAQKKAATRKKPAAPVAKVEAPPPILSDGATRVVDWVASAKDNHALPYIVIDKQGAAAYLFDAKGKMLDHAPVLIGIAPGDDARVGEVAPGDEEQRAPEGRGQRLDLHRQLLELTPLHCHCIHPGTCDPALPGGAVAQRRSGTTVTSA